MRTAALLAILAAACGGNTKPAPQPAPAPPVVAEPAPPSAPEEEEGVYGGAGYGGDEYGIEGGVVGGVVGGPHAPLPPDVAGRWATPCGPTEKKDEFRRVEVELTTDRWDMRVETFKDKACMRRRHAIHLGGPYALVAPSTTVPDAWDATMSFDTRTITADDAKSAKTIAKLCKVKLKAKGTVDVHVAGCPALGLRPAADCAAEHDLVARDGEHLRFGVRPADNDLCTAEKRPTALETRLQLAYVFEPTGIAECDQLVETMRSYAACPALPPGTKTMVFDAVKPMHAQLRQVAQGNDDAQKKAAADGCKQAIDAVTQGMASMGC